MVKNFTSIRLVTPVFLMNVPSPRIPQWASQHRGPGSVDAPEVQVCQPSSPQSQEYHPTTSSPEWNHACYQLVHCTLWLVPTDVQTLSTHAGLVDKSRGDPGLTGDPGAVGHIVLNQLSNERTKVHVWREDHDDLRRGLSNSFNNTLDVLWGTHLRFIQVVEEGKENMLEVIDVIKITGVRVKYWLDRWTDHLWQGLREGDTDSGLLHLVLEVFDAILAIVIISSYCAHPGPAKVQHQLGHSCGLVPVIGNGPQEGGKLELTFQGRAWWTIADLKWWGGWRCRYLIVFIFLISVYPVVSHLPVGSDKVPLFEQWRWTDLSPQHPLERPEVPQCHSGSWVQPRLGPLDK